jgi:uncharacterized protein
MQVKNKTIAITGASRGMGKAFCRRVASEKTDLILVNRKADPTLEKKLLELGAKSVKTYEADLSDMSDVEKVAKKLNEHEIDILFNNAGMLTGGLLENQKMADVHKMLIVNLHTLIHLTHSILPQMLKRKSGKIVNHGSVSSLMYFPCASTYSASKAAVFAFTESLRKELKGTGVSTLVLLTPGVKTDMFDEISDLYGGHIKMKLPSIAADRYVELIYEAIRMDLEILKPSGFTGINLKLSQYIPKAFEYIVDKNFKR